MSTTTWQQWQESLAERFAHLNDDEFITVDVPPRVAGTVDAGSPARRGFFSRLFGSRSEPEGIFLQARRIGQHLYVECVGAQLFGGHFPWTQPQHAELCEMGWRAPGKEPPPLYSRYFPDDSEAGGAADSQDYGQPEDMAAAAELFVTTIRDVYQWPTTQDVTIAGSEPTG